MGTPPSTLAPLRQRFLARCADQLAGLAAIAHRPTPLPSDDSLIRLAQSLSGAASSFGFAEASARDSAPETRLAEQGRLARRSR
jgi:HPt (histidine-containing phosphotransfer) domain-containing protein